MEDKTKTVQGGGTSDSTETQEITTKIRWNQEKKNKIKNCCRFDVFALCKD